ncbi:MAG: sigma-70 family RNA polymerase sigma factor [Pseudomonadota bacterium]
MALEASRAVYLVSTRAKNEYSGSNECVARGALNELMHAIQHQNEEALEKLYEATVDTVFGLVSKILGVGPDAEEVTEDVYMYVWQNASRFDPSRGQPAAWLVVLARSRAIDRYRHRVKQQRLAEALINEDPSECDERDPLALLLETKLRDCVQALPVPQRQILNMAYFRGMTHAEISEELEMSLGTVKSHIRRTLLALRAQAEV